MKAAITALAIIALVPTLLSAQHVPTVVTDAFKAAWPHAQDVEWEKEGANYEAEYKENGHEISVLISPSGTIISIESEISISELPSQVNEYIASEYAGFTIEEAERIQTSDRIYFQVEIENGKQELELAFNLKGEFISLETDEDDDNDGDDD